MSRPRLQNMAFLSDVSVPRMHCLRPGNATGPDSEWRNSTRRCFSDNRAGHVRGRGMSVFVMGAPGSVSERRKTFRFTQIFSHLLAEQLSPRSLPPSLPLSSLLPLPLPCLTQLIETLNGKIRLCPILPAFLFFFLFFWTVDWMRWCCAVLFPKGRLRSTGAGGSTFWWGGLHLLL